MAAGSETRTVAAWMATVLGNDPELMSMVTGVHDTSAPLGVAEPYVAFYPLVVDGRLPVGPNRLGISGTWLVKVVGRTGEYDSLQPIVERIDHLLHARRGRVPGGQVFSSRWLRPFEMATREDGVDFRHLGNEYLVRAR